MTNLFLPLVVDLDGTLISTDMLYETALKSFRSRFWNVLLWPFYLIKGKAFLKQKIAAQVTFDPSLLPYRQDFIAFLKERRSRGQQLFLCTASDKKIADLICSHINIFEEVMASDGVRNLAGRCKAEFLVERFGERGFDYAGNSSKDLQVWQYANAAILVNASRKVINTASALTKIDAIFNSKSFGAILNAVIKTLRPHQWLKNLLLLMPLIAAHKLSQSDNISTILMAFSAFSLCASSVYIFNDLLDLESDRAHPRKCKRPFASADISILLGITVAPLLLLVSAFISFHVGAEFFEWMTVYFFITCAYSWKLKRLILIDCLILALLYTLRIVAGAASVEMSLSFWLLAFSVFLFLSLAFVKRYAELEVQLINGREKIHGRGYYTSDAPILQTLGIASGFASTLVLALYLNSNAVLELYKVPQFIWGAIPVLLFWISWIWMQAHRGYMHDDPLVFAVKDRVSIFSGVLFGLFIWLGAVGF